MIPRRPPIRCEVGAGVACAGWQLFNLILLPGLLGMCPVDCSSQEWLLGTAQRSAAAQAAFQARQAPHFVALQSDLAAAWGLPCRRPRCASCGRWPSLGSASRRASSRSAGRTWAGSRTTRGVTSGGVRAAVRQGEFGGREKREAAGWPRKRLQVGAGLWLGRKSWVGGRHGKAAGRPRA